MLMIKRKTRKDLGLSHLGCYNSPPLEGIAPRFLWRCEESGILGSEKIFAFPCLKGVRMIRPLHFEELEKGVRSNLGTHVVSRRKQDLKQTSREHKLEVEVGTKG